MRAAAQVFPPLPQFVVRLVVPAFSHVLSFDNNTNNAEKIDDDTFEVLVDNGKSDSANLDSVVELLVQSSKSPTEALMIMVPEAFRSQPALNSRPEVRCVWVWGVGVRV